MLSSTTQTFISQYEIKTLKGINKKNNYQENRKTRATRIKLLKNLRTEVIIKELQNLRS